MRRLAKFLKYWFPLILWMALIFSASSDALSSDRTSRIIGPFLRWWKPDISEKTIYRVQTVVRKGGHVGEYAVLAMLLLRAVRGTRAIPSGRWDRRAAALALALTVAYACTDELHQLLVPSRDGRVRDVLLDSAGAMLGLLAVRVWFWRRNRAASVGTGRSPEGSLAISR